VDVVGGQVGQGAAAGVLALGPHRPSGPGRQRQVGAHARLDAGFLVRAEHVLVRAERFSLPGPLVQVKDAPGLEGEVRVAGEDPRPVLPGLQGVVGEPAAHGGRRDRRDDAAGSCMAGQFRAGPAGQRRPARGGQLASQGLHLGHDPGGELARPAGPRASASPSRPCSQYRRRHLRAVSSQIPSRPAIAEFAAPPAASSTIRARMTIWYGAVPRREGLQLPAAGLAQGYGIRTGRHGAPAAGRDPDAAVMQAPMVQPDR